MKCKQLSETLQPQGRKVVGKTVDGRYVVVCGSSLARYGFCKDHEAKLYTQTRLKKEGTNDY